nr:hypothetical protein [Chloroflexota bacterium]
HRALVCLTREQATLGSRLRRIRGRRPRAIARISIDPALELLNTLKQHRQFRDLLQQLDHEPARRTAAGQRDRLDLILPHACKIPCVTQEPSPASRHPLNAYLGLDKAPREVVFDLMESAAKAAAQLPDDQVLVRTRLPEDVTVGMLAQCARAHRSLLEVSPKEG